MPIAFYISHPQVAIDPSVPVPRWSLSDVGRQRLHAITSETWIRSLARIVSSDETKAIETAAIIAGVSNAPVAVQENFGENDRSSTGYLPPPEFEATADAFFANPGMSIRGWERAIDAQARIVRAVTAALDDHNSAFPIAFSGHGGVGTLLFCHLAGRPIDRRYDQSGGGGNVFAIDLVSRRPLFAWTPLEAVTQRLRDIGS